MSPRLQIIKEDKVVKVIGDFSEDSMPIEEATEYFRNWLSNYSDSMEEDCHFFFEDKTGNKTEIKLQ